MYNYSMKLDYHLYKVFTSVAKGGGPLAIVEIPIELENKIPDTTLIKIAQDFNFPETVFLYKAISASSLAKIRIFTITRELPMAGHPTIGTAHYLKLKNAGNNFVLDLKIGPTEITFDEKGCAYMLQQAHRSRKFAKEDTLNLVDALCLNSESINTVLPIEFSSTGLEFLMIPLVNEEYLKAVKPNYNKIKSLLSKYDSHAIYLFCETSKNNYKVRMFMLELDVLVEDPATGSAAGSFNMYLHKNSQTLDLVGQTIKISQGFEIGSPSEIYTSITKREDGELVPRVGGNAVKIGQGKLGIVL